MEKDRGDDEEAEEDDLHTKTRDDDGFSLASLICRIRVCELCATCFDLSAAIAARIQLVNASAVTYLVLVLQWK